MRAAAIDPWRRTARMVPIPHGKRSRPRSQMRSPTVSKSADPLPRRRGPGARRVRDHPEALDSHPVQEVEGLDDRPVGKAPIGLEEHEPILAAAQETFESIPQETERHRSLV